MNAREERWCRAVVFHLDASVHISYGGEAHHQTLDILLTDRDPLVGEGRAQTGENIFC